MAATTALHVHLATPEAFPADVLRFELIEDPAMAALEITNPTRQPIIYKVISNSKDFAVRSGYGVIAIGGQKELINRSKKNLQSVKDWIDARDWVDFLAKDPKTYSSTSICFKFTHPDFEKLDDDNKKKLVKEVCSTIEKEDAGYDINAYKDAPAGIRIWGGATVESSDIDKLLPWIEWAFFETLERYK